MSLPYLPAVPACSIVCVHSTLTELSTVIESPVRSVSSVAELYWVTPCWLAALPVLTTC